MIRRSFYGLLILSLTLALFADRPAGDEFAIAIEAGDAAKVAELLKANPPDTWIEYGEHKITPLMKAAWEGNAAIVKTLLDAGANVNASATDTKETALMSAVTRRHLEVLTVLLEAGADVKPKNTYGMNAFSTAVAAGNQDVVAALLKAGAKIEEGAHGITPLQFAISAGNEELVRFLVSSGADVNHGAKSGGQTPLLSAIYAAKPAMVKLLIELKANVNTKTKDGDTPLTAAAKGDQEDIIAMLKSAGAKR